MFKTTLYVSFTLNILQYIYELQFMSLITWPLKHMERKMLPNLLPMAGRHELFPNKIIPNVKILNVKIPTRLMGFT